MDTRPTSEAIDLLQSRELTQLGDVEGSNLNEPGRWLPNIWNAETLATYRKLLASKHGLHEVLACGPGLDDLHIVRDRFVDREEAEL